MNYYFKSSFTKLFKKLGAQKQKQVVYAIETLKSVIDSRVNPQGLGLKRLKNQTWEIRSSLKDRIIFTYQKDAITFVLVGNHDDIIRFLKGV